MTLQPIFDYRILIKSFFNKRNSIDRIFVKSGRIAFSSIISIIRENNKINKIILPNLICDELIEVAQSHKIKIDYYNIDNKLNYNMKEIEELAVDKNNIIVFVNYFGFESNHIISDKLKNNFIVEDNAHMFRHPENNKIKTYVDFSFTSLRKLLPVLSGAEINSNKYDVKLKQSTRLPNFGEIKYSLRGLKSSRGGTSKLGHLSSNINYDLSSIDILSKNIINNYNFIYDDIKNKRRNNFIFWENYLANQNISFMKNITNNLDICPYAFPCYVNNEKQRDKWIMWGEKHNVTIISWPKYHKETLKYVPDNFLKRILLFPVNHQFDLYEIIR